MTFRFLFTFLFLSLAAPALAQSGDGSEQASPAGQAASPMRVPMRRGPEAMAMNLEERIKMLRETLGITREQEPAWNAVAQVMRENEGRITALIDARRRNADTFTAIDNLKTFEAMTQAHLEGIKKMIPAFQVLYNQMSDEQKIIADKTFGRFEGRKGHSSDKKN